MAICPICKVDEIPLRAPGLGGGPLITCKNPECRRLYLNAQTRQNWRTHRYLQRVRAGQRHPCYVCGELTILLKPTCGAPPCVKEYREGEYWRWVAKEEARKRAE